jgi:hypothetical protein
MKASELTQYAGTGIEAIDKALDARRKVIEQFKTIDQAQNVKSLTPFLNSELEEVKKYAEKRRRFLNVDYKGGGNKNNDSFAEYLKEKKKQYEEYNAIVKQLGEEEATANYSNLIKEGKDYREFLENKLEETKEFSKQRDIALAAQSSGFVLNPSAPTPEQIGPLVETSVDTSSINYYNSQLTRLREERRAARTQEQREELELEIAKWEEKLRIAENGSLNEESIYSNLRRGLEDLNNNQLRDYIKYWKQRLQEAKGNARKEQEALDNIQSAKNRIAENTKQTLSDISGSLGEASNMFREFGDNVLADALEKMSGLANNMGTIIAGVTSGNFLAVAGGLIGAVTSLIQGRGNEKGRSEYERTIKGLESSISVLGNQIERAFGTEAIKLSEAQLTKYRESIEAVTVEYDKMVDINNRLYEMSKTGNWDIDLIEEWEKLGGVDRLLELEEKLNSLQSEYTSALNQYGQDLTGITSDSITDSIIEGFRNGKTAVEDFADSFEDMMKKAMLQAFQVKYLEGAVNEFYDSFALAGKDQVYTQTEIESLRDLYSDMIEGAGADIDAINEILDKAGLGSLGGVLGDQRQGLSGSIKGITEDQAGILEGYMNAMRLDLRSVLNLHTQNASIAIQGNIYLSEIAVNTRYNRFLESIDGRMATIERGVQEYQAQG